MWDNARADTLFDCRAPTLILHAKIDDGDAEQREREWKNDGVLEYPVGEMTEIAEEPECAKHERGSASKHE